MAGGIVGMAAGVVAALVPWPGILMLAGVIVLGVGLAARARAIAVIVKPGPTWLALETASEARTEQPSGKGLKITGQGAVRPVLRLEAQVSNIGE